MELHLLDTSVFFPVVLGVKKKEIRKLQKDPEFPYQQKIIEAIEEGSCKKCVVTISVMNELKSKEADLWFTRIGESSSALLYLTEPSEEDSYLLEQLNALASKKYRTFGAKVTI